MLRLAASEPVRLHDQQVLAAEHAQAPAVVVALDHVGLALTVEAHAAGRLEHDFDGDTVP